MAPLAKKDPHPCTTPITELLENYNKCVSNMHVMKFSLCQAQPCQTVFAYHKKTISITVKLAVQLRFVAVIQYSNTS